MPRRRGKAQGLVNTFLPHFIIFLACRHVQAAGSSCFVLEEAVSGLPQVSFPGAALPAVPTGVQPGEAPAGRHPAGEVLVALGLSSGFFH